MRNLPRLFAAVVLVLALTAPALAGEIECGVALALALSLPAAAGEMECGNAPSPGATETRGEMDTGVGAALVAGGPMTEAVLRLLAGVLTLL